MNNDFLQQLEVMENPNHQEQGLTPSSSFPVDPDFCVTTSFQLLTLTLSYCQSNNLNPTQKISRSFIFNLKSTMTKKNFK
jgi:hypothetical protein